MLGYKLDGYASQGKQIPSEGIKACLQGGWQPWFENGPARLTSKRQKQASVSRLADGLNCEEELIF